jgi:hypothetical protein
MTRHTAGISSKDLLKARRNAERKRTSVACARCKAGKVKCSDYRPCKHCKYSNKTSTCVDEAISIQQKQSGTLSNTPPDANAYERFMQGKLLLTRSSCDRVSQAYQYFDRPTAPGIRNDFSDHISSVRANSYSPAPRPTNNFLPAGTSEQNYNSRNSNESGYSSQKTPRLNAHTCMPKSSEMYVNPVHITSSSTQRLLSGIPRIFRTHQSNPERTSLQLNSQPSQYTSDPYHGIALLPIVPTSSPQMLSWTFQPIFTPTVPLLRMAPQTIIPPVAALIFGLAAAIPPHRHLETPCIDNSLLLALRDGLQTVSAASFTHSFAPFVHPPLPGLRR